MDGAWEDPGGSENTELGGWSFVEAVTFASGVVALTYRPQSEAA
jgi:hypothetical protein